MMGSALFIEDKNTLGPVDAAFFQSLRREVKDVLNTLTERENRVLQLRRIDLPFRSATHGPT